MKQKEFMRFRDIKYLFENTRDPNWIYLYKKIENKPSSVLYSYLAEKTDCKKLLKNYSWEFHIGDIENYGKIRPILIRRMFFGMKKEYWEIIENLRFLFNLYEDNNRNLYHIDDSGNEEKVVELSENEVKIKKSLLMNYLFNKKLVLIQCFDFFRGSSKTLKELRLSTVDKLNKGSKHIYHVVLRDNNENIIRYKSISLIMGKKIIMPPKKFKNSLFSKEKNYEEFIVGVDASGSEKTFTCNEKRSAKTEKNPSYLTPIFFKKEVLNKYYNTPEKYSVEDGLIRCGGLWILRIDNNNEDSVMVFLGDLGKLPYQEQKYWRSYNISSGKISHTAFQRNFEAQFENPKMPDLYFKQKFQQFQNKWYKKYGWYLFHPLKKEDEHYFLSLRMPTKESQKDFDEFVGSITKITVDSINVKELTKGLNYNKKNDKSITILEKYLKQKHNINFPKMFEFLRKLQNLRSNGTAHRKGKGYTKIKEYFGLNGQNFKKVSSNILVKCIWMLNSFSNEKYGLLK